jgi:hypothetical protein
VLIKERAYLTFPKTEKCHGEGEGVATRRRSSPQVNGLKGERLRPHVSYRGAKTFRDVIVDRTREGDEANRARVGVVTEREYSVRRKERRGKGFTFFHIIIMICIIVENTFVIY